MADDPVIVPDEPIHTVKPSEKPVDVPATIEDLKDSKEAPDVAEPEAEDSTQAKAEEPEERRPRSGYARLKARHQAVIAELEALKQQSSTKGPAPDEIKPPKVEDFNGDYLAFERASVAYEARQAVKDELGKFRQADVQQKLQESQQEHLSDFIERWNEWAEKKPDAPELINKLYATVGQEGFKPTVRNLIADADNGEVILYYLAQNPGEALYLNSLPSTEAARMIGQLEVKTTLPKPKTETKAPPPFKTPKGGAAPPRDLAATAAKSEGIADYIKMRQAMMKKD